MGLEKEMIVVKSMRDRVESDALSCEYVAGDGLPNDIKKKEIL